MEFRQLQYFAAVVDAGSFSAAARRCGVTQPTLSQQVAALEEELGETLLRRGARGVSLTEAGEVAYGRALYLLGGRDDLLGTFQQRGSHRRGELSFGVIPTVAPWLLPDLLAAFREWAPEIHLSVRESQTARLVRMVVDEEIEFAVVSDIDSATRKKWSLHVRLLKREPLVLAVPETDPRARLARAVDVASIEPATVLSLADGHCLRDQTPAQCRPRDTRERTTCEQLPTLLALVRAGLGVAFVPAMFAREAGTPGVAFLPVYNPEAKRAINVMKRRGRKLNPAASWLLNRIAER